MVALTAQLEQIEIKHKNLQKKWKDNQKKKKKDDKPKGSKKFDNKKWKWKSVAPKSNESKTKVFEGKTYLWCPHHKKWTLHKPDECCLKDGKITIKKKEPQLKPRPMLLFLMMVPSPTSDGIGGI